MGSDILERLQAIEDKLDEILELLSRDDDFPEVDDEYRCPRCGNILEGDRRFVHSCEVL